MKDRQRYLERRVEQLSRLVEVSHSIASRLDLEPLLQEIVDVASRLIGAELGGLLVLSQEKGHPFDFFKVYGWPYPINSVPKGTGLFAAPLRDGQPLRVADVRQHPQAVGMPPNHPPVRALLSVPLQSQGHVLGVLFVGNGPRKPAFTSDDEDLLFAFSTQATIAIENARLYAQSQEMARLRERERLANDLHDTVAQLFYGIGLEAKQGLDAMTDGFTPVAHLETIGHLSAQGSIEVRNAIFALSQDNGRETLASALRTLVQEFEESTAIETCLVLPPQLTIHDTKLKTVAVRVVQEALANVRKHANATMVLVALSSAQDGLVVTIQDDGVGIPSSRLSRVMQGDTCHFGVRTMRTMLERVGGQLDLSRGDEGGLIVKGWLPMAQQKEEDR